MVASSFASPLCTWLVAACMSVSCEKDHFLKSPSLFQCSRRLSRSARRRKVVVPQCLNVGGGLVSSFCSSGSQNWLNSCLTFEPCEEYYNSEGLASSLACFSENAFSLFGYKAEPVTRRRRRMSRDAHSGKVMAVAMLPDKEAIPKKKSLMEKRRVVVTGVGVVSSLGHDADIFYKNLLEGRIAGKIKDFSADGWVAPKLCKRADKFMLYMLTAGKKALADGGITDVMEEIDKSKCGVLIGSALGGMKVFNDAIEALRVSYKKMNPFCVHFASTNMGSAMLSMDLLFSNAELRGWMGPNYSISTACATSNFCILNAANHIIRGHDAVVSQILQLFLSVSDDFHLDIIEVTPSSQFMKLSLQTMSIGLGGFVACGALSQKNGDPTRASCPWDVDRDGFVMGEGAGVLLLEELEHAKRRDANIYAEFLSGSFTCDAYHMTEPHPDRAGIVLCMEKVLAQSGVAIEDINYINAHATSTRAGDLKEFEAVMRCFGQHPEIKMNSTKSMVGHLLGAAGAVEVVATVKAIHTGWIHPNINLENADKGVDTSVLVGPEKEQLEIMVALSNSFVFGGHNSSILFAPCKHG